MYSNFKYSFVIIIMKFVINQIDIDIDTMISSTVDVMAMDYERESSPQASTDK